jgi:hypothetical protein
MTVTIDTHFGLCDAEAARPEAGDRRFYLRLLAKSRPPILSGRLFDTLASLVRAEAPEIPIRGGRILWPEGSCTVRDPKMPGAGHE